MRNLQQSIFSILTIIPVKSHTGDSSFEKDLAYRVLCFFCWLAARSIKFDVLIFDPMFPRQREDRQGFGYDILGMVREYSSYLGILIDKII